MTTRIIKFRAWDIKMKKYLTWEQDREFILDAIPWEMGDEWSECCIVEQFTGLRDTKGKEIYEGDILRYQTSPDYQVIFQRAEFCAKIDTKDGIGICTLARIAEIGAVVGNIHEKQKRSKK